MQNLLKKYHMDEPLYKQYFRYLGDICRGDLGPSFKFKDFTVNELIFQSLPNSITLGCIALASALILALQKRKYENKL